MICMKIIVRMCETSQKIDVYHFNLARVSPIIHNYKDAQHPQGVCSTKHHPIGLYQVPKIRNSCTNESTCTEDSVIAACPAGSKWQNCKVVWFKTFLVSCSRFPESRRVCGLLVKCIATMAFYCWETDA